MRKSGFTLIELSIVIVIISLIIAGVSAGKMIVRQAKIRSVIADLDKYKSTANTFKIQYNALPGDMINATNYFGSANVHNGNGNGTVETFGSGAEEEHLFWNHLLYAGLISGNYLIGNLSNTSLRNYNVPSTYGGELCFGIRERTRAIGGGSTTKMGSGRGSYFLIGSERSGLDCSNKGFIPENLLAIDTKIDDGKPDAGLILGVSGANSSNQVTGCESAGTYNLSNSYTECILLNDRPW